MDSSELNKIAGGVIAALLVFMLLNFFSDQIYHAGGHGDEEVLAYAVEIEDAAPADDADDGPSVADLLAAADPEKGKKVYKKCGACHKADKNGVGPMLGGVVGRDIGSIDGYGYSGGLTSAEGNWDPEKLFAFLGNPKEWGSSMSFNLKKEEDRAAVIAYLATLN